MLDDGEIERRVRLLRPVEHHHASLKMMAESHWQETDRDAFAAAWNREVAQVPEFSNSTIHIVAGLLLPIWKRLPNESTRVYRLQTDEGERIIGRRVSPAWVAGALATGASTLTAGDAFAALLDGSTILAFAIRKPAVAVFTLQDYVATAIMSADQAAILRQAVAERRNILVAGGTSTGKTTLTNALLAEVAKTEDRVVLIEDTRELQCAAPNLVAMRTKDGVATLSELVRSSLRLRPDRIPIGEVRGAEALDLLKAWGTGHPGGIGTIHAGTALGALRRLEQLIQEAVVTVPRALIAETVDLVAVLSGRGSTRRLAELARVEGLTAEGDYRITPQHTP